MTKPFYVALAMMLSNLGCGTDCTAVGCVDGVLITLASPVPIATQELTVHIDSDGTEMHCTVGPTSRSCQGGTLTVVIREQAIRTLEVGGTPKRIGVTISSANTTVLTGEVVPQYETTHPNGSDCPGSCKRADATLGS